MTHPVIVDLFSSVVAEVSAAMGQTVHFMHGHMLEIANQVQKLSVDPDTDKRYPLIALQHDFKQKPVGYKGIELSGLKLYIITLSRPEYIAQERMDLIFETILYPIRYELINRIAKSGYFEQSTVEEVEEVTEWIDHLFWGREQVMGNDGNIFSDWVDCIEVIFNGLVAFSSCGVSSRNPAAIEAFTDDTGDDMYIVFNSDMADPAGHEADIVLTATSIVVGAEADPPITPLSLSLYSARIVRCNIKASTLKGKTLTLSIASGNIADVNGNLLKAVSGLSVTNNVL